MGQTTLYTFNGGGTTGDWNSTSTWTTDPTGSTAINQRVPVANDNVVVTNSYIVTLSSNISSTISGLNLTIQRGGVLDLGIYTTPTLNSLAGQGVLRITAASTTTLSFPTVTTNNFDDANTGTVEFYNLPAGATVLPIPAVGYNNLRLLNTTGTAYEVQLDNNLTLNGSLTLTRTNAALTLNLGKTASQNRTLTVLGDINVGVGTTLGVTAAAGSHTLIAGGSFVNAGTVNLHNGTSDDTQVALLKFTGAKDANFACNGPTALDILRVDKGVDSQVMLNVTSTVAGTTGNLRLNHMGAPAKLLDLVNGVTKLGNNINLPKIFNPTTASLTDADDPNGWYELGSSSTSPTLWIAGATVLNDNATLFAIYGTYRISGGRLSSVVPTGMVVREDAQVLVEGGTTTVSQFRPSYTSSGHRGSFIITAGTFESVGMVTLPLSTNPNYTLTTTRPTYSYNFARFAVPYTTQGFRMSGGTLRVANPDFNDKTLSTTGVKDGLFDIGVNPNNATVSGGTIELWVPSSTTSGNNATIMTTSPLWNLTIKKPVTATGDVSKAMLAFVSVPTAYATGAPAIAQSLTVLNNLTLDPTKALTFDAANQNLTIQGSFNIGTSCTYLTGTNTTTFSGGQDQVLTNNGTISNSTLATLPTSGIGATGNGTFNTWIINKPAGTLTLGGTVMTYYTPAGTTLSLLSGVLNDGGKTINVQGSIVNSGSHTSGGGAGSIVMNGAAAQTIGGDGTGVFGNLKVISTTTTGTVAVTLTANIAVTSVLTLQSVHILSIGAYRLSLTNVNTNALQPSSNTFSNQRMIQTAGNQSDLGLQKTYGGLNSFFFPVGTGSKYTPVTISITGSTALPRYGQVSVSPVNNRNPFVASATNSLAYYWKVRSVGFNGIPAGAISASFQMVNSDAAGSSTSYIGARYLPTAWNTFSNSATVTDYGTGSSSIDFNSLDQFDGEFTAGYLATFAPVTSFYSRQTGAWTTNTTWSTGGYNGAAVPSNATPTAGVNFPGPGNPVFIGSATNGAYHKVTTTANGAQSGSLVIDRGSTLDVVSTTGHNFGALPDSKVGGSGRLRISSSSATVTFPGGDFGSFIQYGGGTVEYYTTGTSFTVPTASATPSTLTLNQYRNLWLNAASGQTITLPNQNLRIYAQLKTGVADGATAFPGTVLISSAASGNLRADSLLNVMAGTLRLQGTTPRSLTFDTNVQVDNGATFDAINSTTTNVIHALTVGGSLVNNGTLDFKVGTALANLTFVGAQNNSFTSAGPLTDLYTLTLNKGLGRASQLTLDGSGQLSTPTNPTNGWLTLTNGTLNYTKPSNGGTVPNVLTIHDAASPYLITDNAGLTVNTPGGTVTVATKNDVAADLRLAGQLTVVQGTLQVGASGNAGNDLEYASAGAPGVTVTGGNLYVNGQLRRTVNNLDGSLRFDQSGGTIDIDGKGATAAQNNERGLFEVQGTGSIFRMSSGTLNLHRSNQKNPILTADFYLAPDSTVVTGGTVVLGNATAGVGKVTISVNSTVPLYDLRVEAGADSTNANTGLLTGVIPLTLKNSLTIGNNNSIFNANGLGLNIGQNLINNNTSAKTALSAASVLKAGGFRPGTTTQLTTFTGSPTTQLLIGTASNLTVFGSLTLNTPQPNGTLQLGGNALVAGTLTLTKGTLNDNDRTITVLGNVLNSATHASGGTGSGSLILGGSVNQSVGGNNKGVFGNLTLNNAAGATTTANQEITKVLSLSNTNGGILNIGSNLLVLSNPLPGAVTGYDAKHYIRTNGIVADLGVRKNYPNAAYSFTFPLGSATKYTPVTMNLKSASSAGTITVQPIDLAHPSTTDPASPIIPNKISFYWKVSSTLSSPTVDMTYTYTDADVIGTEAYILGRFYNGAWQPTGGIVGSSGNAGANTLSVSNYTGVPTAGIIDGDYTGGNASEFAPVLTYYSRNATAGLAGGSDWTNPLTWTTVTPDGSGPAAATYPKLGNPVVINSGHLVTTSSAGQASASLNLLGTLDLSANGANNFSTIKGTGTLRIGSALFPAGNYSDFVASSGGTVEFTAAVQLPARDTYNNLSLSGTTSKQLSNLDLTINGALSVATNTIVDNPTSQNLTLTSASSGAAIDGTLNMFDGKLTTAADLTVGSNGTLSLGAGLTQVSRNFTNNGTTNNGSAGVQVGAAFSNGGTYNANANVGPLTVAGTFTNSGTYKAGTGRLTVSSAGSFINTATGTFTAINNGYVQVDGNYTNAGKYYAAENILRVAGNFTNTGMFNSQSVNEQDGTISDVSSATLLFGNFTNSGTFTAGTGVVQFTADNAARLLTGNTGFYNLQKTGAYNLNFNSNSSVSVSNLLTLSGGLIATGTSNTLQLNNRATQPIVGATPTSYVNGRLAMALPNTAASIRVFPVGLGGRYRPVTITPQAASTNPVVLVEIINQSPTTLGTPDAGLSNVSANRYYRIQLLSGIIAQPVVQLSFNTDVTDEQVNVPGNLRVAYFNTGTSRWSTAGGSGVFSPDYPRGYTISASAKSDGTSFINSTSLFALASTNYIDNPLTGQAPLPVQLLSFTAARQGTTVRTAWTTASEKNSAYFVVQRSADGRTFSDGQQVVAQGNSLMRHDYAAVDTKPLPGTSYYRLRQVDLDGTVAYSPVATVHFDDVLAAPALVVYPNPNAGQHFQVLATNLALAGGTVQLFDNVGRLLLTQIVPASAAEASIQPAQTLASGLYLVTWQTADGLKLVKKLIVE
jgi:fibronectin-binding autotransporter adhesin